MRERDSHHAYRLAKAVQAVRQLPYLKGYKRLRASPEFAALVEACNRYADDRRAEREAQEANRHDGYGLCSGTGRVWVARPASSANWYDGGTCPRCLPPATGL